MTTKKSLNEYVKDLTARGIRYCLKDNVMSYVDKCTAQTVVLKFNSNGELLNKQARTLFMF